MMWKNLFNVIGEIKTPERKLNVLMPVMVVFVLAGVVYFLFNQVSNNRESDLNDCRQENIELKKEEKALIRTNDSLIFKAVNDKQETINKLKELIKNQDAQKKIVRK